MRIILKENIEKLGFADEVVKVKNGFARNFLIPQGKAILATDSAVKVLEEKLRQQSGKEEKEVKKEETLSNTETNEDSNSLILNILKLDGYKMDSGELFQAFREAGGEMEDFKNELDKLSETGKIKSDSDGNIMTVQDFKHEKSQQEEEQADVTKEEDVEEATKEKDSEGDDKAEDIEDESEEYTAEEVADEKDSGESSAEEDEDIESIIKLKEETDNWLIDQLKNKGNGSSDEELKAEVAKLKDRVQKLENVIKNITKAFK